MGYFHTRRVINWYHYCTARDLSRTPNLSDGDLPGYFVFIGEDKISRRFSALPESFMEATVVFCVLIIPTPVPLIVPDL